MVSNDYGPSPSSFQMMIGGFWRGGASAKAMLICTSPANKVLDNLDRMW